jgi:hypothetical protein
VRGVFSLVAHVVAIEAVNEKHGAVFGGVSSDALHVGQHRVRGGAVPRQVLVVAVVASVERAHSQIYRVNRALKLQNALLLNNLD